MNQQQKAKRMLRKGLDWYVHPIKVEDIHMVWKWQREMMHQMYEMQIIDTFMMHRCQYLYLTDKGLKLAHEWFPTIPLTMFHREKLDPDQLHQEKRMYFYVGFDDRDGHMIYAKEIDLDHQCYSTTDNEDEAYWTSDRHDRNDIDAILNHQMHLYESSVWVC